jgi:arylsulfatase A-like enzyme
MPEALCHPSLGEDGLRIHETFLACPLRAVALTSPFSAVHSIAMTPCCRRLTALAGVLCFAFTATAETNKFNVLFIIADDFRAEAGSYGSKLAKTPNIDSLASAGVRFDRAYCQIPLCNPSRASMLTGRHPTTTGVLGNRTDFRGEHSDWVTLPELFKKNGYVSLRTGKIFHGGIDDTQSWTEGAERQRLPGVRGRDNDDEAAEDSTRTNRPARNPPASAQQALARAQRSDRWVVLEGNGESHGDYRVADQAIRFLRDNKDKPFFLGCGFVKPHSPPTAPQRFYDLWDVDEIPLPPDFAPRPTVPEGFPKLSIRPRNADLFIGRDASPEEARQMIRAYLASSAWMDWNVGRVIAELDNLGLRDKTIIVFWGDHGYQLGEKGKWSKAGSLFEQGTRTPFIIVAPGAAGNGKASERVVEAVDFYPTIAELCGLPVPGGVEGRSLAPLLKNPDAKWDHPAFSVWSEDGRTLHGVAVRNERWRYAEFKDGGAMLLDPQADPHEMKNLAGDPALADVRAELSKLIRQYTNSYAP